MYRPAGRAHPAFLTIHTYYAVAAGKMYGGDSFIRRFGQDFDRKGFRTNG